MHVLVTGSSGPIGRAVSRALREADHHVTGADARPLAATCDRTVRSRPDDPDLAWLAPHPTDIVVHCAREPGDDASTERGAGIGNVLAMAEEREIARVLCLAPLREGADDGRPTELCDRAREDGQAVCVVNLPRADGPRDETPSDDALADLVVELVGIEDERFDETYALTPDGIDAGGAAETPGSRPFHGCRT